ncbi:MAG TPA: hypothetical protein VG498_10985, partial [Terriglobales bacterium]|nr:hypothetical protein [Terriglobales bacterium]
MLRTLCVIWIFMVTLAAFGQSSEKYQLATVTAVTPHQAQDETGTGVVRYDVFLKIGGTIYQVLYTPPFGANTVKY